MKILIVDQNPEVINALSLILEQEQDLEIIAKANDLVGLFKYIAKSCPDVLILDMDIQGITRNQKNTPAHLTGLLETIHELCPNIQIIALSILTNIKTICVNAGVNDFVCKSNPPDKLLAHLRRLKMDELGK